MVVAGRAVLAMIEVSDLIGFSKNENRNLSPETKILQSNVGSRPSVKSLGASPVKVRKGIVSEPKWWQARAHNLGSRVLPWKPRNDVLKRF